MDQAGTGGMAVPDIAGEEGDEALMARNGITCVRADQFHVDGYRYGNLADALAQVARGAGRRQR